MPRQYYVYILSSAHGALYIGVTNDLERRLYEHKAKLVEGFTKRYNIDRLMYFEATDDVLSVIERKKQIKGWTRRKKYDLIRNQNPKLVDLSSSLGFQESYANVGELTRDSSLPGRIGNAQNDMETR